MRPSTSIPASEIRAARARLGLSVVGLARFAGVSHTTIWRIERGHPVAERTLRGVVHALLNLSRSGVRGRGRASLPAAPCDSEDGAAA